MGWKTGQKIIDILTLKFIRKPFKEDPSEKKFKNMKYKELVNSSLDKINHAIIHNKVELDEFVQKNKAIFEKCKKLNEEMKVSDSKKDFIHGYCCNCEEEVDFMYDLLPQYSPDVMFRERVICPICDSVNRIRAMMYIFQSFEKNPVGLTLYAYEYNTSFFRNMYRWLHYKNTFIGSEYFGKDVASGTMVNGVRHEDAQNLSFRDNQLDYIFSNDVFEHVPDIDKTLSEVYRCLKSGGRLIANIPFSQNQEKTIVRAKIEDSKIVYLEEKEYHGGFSFDDENGCLAFYSYGTDIFDKIKSAGFSNSYGIAIADEKYGNIDYNPIVIFVAEK